MEKNVEREAWISDIQKFRKQNQMRTGTDRKIFGEALDQAKKNRIQITQCVISSQLHGVILRAW
jgi:hypothetical protein